MYDLCTNVNKKSSNLSFSEFWLRSNFIPLLNYEALNRQKFRIICDIGSVYPSYLFFFAFASQQKIQAHFDLILSCFC